MQNNTHAFSLCLKLLEVLIYAQVLNRKNGAMVDLPHGSIYSLFGSTYPKGGGGLAIAPLFLERSLCTLSFLLTGDILMTF